MSARIKVFHFGYNIFKLQSFLFLVNVQSWDTCGREARTRTNFWVDKGKWIAVGGALKRKKRVLSFSVNVQSIKMKYVSNYCVRRCDINFMHRFCQSATSRYQSISIYLLIVIENRYQLITTQILNFYAWVTSNVQRLKIMDDRKTAEFFKILSLHKLSHKVLLYYSCS